MKSSTEKYPKMQSETFGAFIRAARERCGLSMAQAGERLKCTKGYVLRLEQGKANNPTIDTLANIAAGYGLDLAELAARAAASSPNAQHRRVLTESRALAPAPRTAETKGGNRRKRS